MNSTTNIAQPASFTGNALKLMVLCMVVIPGIATAQVHGCTFETAEDLRGQAMVDLVWDFPHNRCIIVDTGTTVRWNGSFLSHPLVGGVVATPDNDSPITMASPEGNVTSVTFDAVGDYPYYCTVHTSSMDGVVYVRDVEPSDAFHENGFESPPVCGI